MKKVEPSKAMLNQYPDLIGDDLSQAAALVGTAQDHGTLDCRNDQRRHVGGGRVAHAAGAQFVGQARPKSQTMTRAVRNINAIGNKLLQ